MLVVLLTLLGSAATQNLFCSEEFCEKYRGENGCPGLAEGCHIQNKTHNGLDLPFPGPCDCCGYCLENVKEGGDCIVGSQTSIEPKTICGPDLFCDDNKCTSMKSACADDQKNYDEKRKDGTLGHMELRVDCDQHGVYEPYICIPGEICYCVNEKKERIFGEIPFTSLAKYLMHCECSRAHDAISKYLGKPLLRHQHMRCKPDGSYDTIQCIGKQCLCVDSEDGKPTFPKKPLVNMTQITPNSLPCFDNMTHIENDYYRVCEEKLMRIQADVEEMQLLGHEIVGIQYPSCQLDGFYAAVQSNQKQLFCATPQGEVMEEYVVQRDSPLAENMNCKCARARSIIVGDELPECLPNGNYKPLQCRRGLCRCVDDNGNQIKKELPIEKVQNCQ